MSLGTDTAQQVHRQLQQHHHAVIEDIRLPETHFRTSRQPTTTNLLLMQTTQSRFHIYVDDDVEYLGTQLPRGLFTHEVRDGWQRLQIPNDGQIHSTLQTLAAVLGLEGKPPHLPQRMESIQQQSHRKAQADELEPADESMATTGVSPDALEQFGSDLTALARQGKLNPVIGRDREMQSTAGVLLKRGKNTPVLIGEAGVGKSAIVEGLAQRIVEEQVPAGLREHRIIEVNLGLLVAGAAMKGELEQRVQDITESAKNDPTLILFFDELHTLCSTRGDNDIATMLKSDLARGRFRVIGATTYRDYRQSVERDAALARRFQQVLVKEPSDEETLEILQGLRPMLEAHHQVRIPDEVMQAAVQQSAWYITDRYLPDKAIDLLDESCVRLRLSQEETMHASAGTTVAPEDVPLS